MSHLFRKVVLFLVFLIAVLQIIHMSLMSRLESRSSNIKNNHNLKKNIEKSSNHQAKVIADVPYTLQDVVLEREHMYKSLQSLSSVLDSSGEYRIVNFFATANSFENSRWKYSIISKLDTLDGSNLYKKNDLAIATHCTVNQLYNLDLLSKRWNGPISISIFAISIQQLPIIVEVILFLRYCNPSIRQRTSFHLVYPLNFSTKLTNKQVRSVLDFLRWPTIKDTYPEFDQFISEKNCGNLEKSIEQMVVNREKEDNIIINYNHHVPYPNNLLRNTARRYSLTEYTLVIDVDLVPSANLYERFIEFAENSKLFQSKNFFLDHHVQEERIVFVVPTFEIDLNQSTLSSNIPNDKLELIKGVEKKFIRPFYIELCWKCQKYTDYDSWLHAAKLINQSNSFDIEILFEVQWHDPWEPFYISRNNVPLYDERFKQYGFNRISQVCELNVAGFRFAVLNNAFLIHRGFKTPNGFHPNKDDELEQNRVLFRKFKLQLKERYPTSLRKC